MFDGDAQLVDVADPLVALGLLDLRFKVGADLIEPIGLGWVNLEEIATQASMFVNAI